MFKIEMKSTVKEKVTAETFELDNKKPLYADGKAKAVIEGYFINHFSPEVSLTEKDIKIVHNVKGVGKVRSNKGLYLGTDFKTGSPKFYYDSDKKVKCELTNKMNESKLASTTGMATDYGRSIEANVLIYVTKFTCELENKKGELQQVVKTPNQVFSMPVNVADLYFPSSASGRGKLLNTLVIDDEDPNEIAYPLATNKVSIGNKTIKVLSKSPLTKESKEVQKEVESLRKSQDEVKSQFAHLEPIPYQKWYNEHVLGVLPSEADEVDDSEEMDF